jgi:hypothetical protein
VYAAVGRTPPNVGSGANVGSRILATDLTTLRAAILAIE